MAENSTSETGNTQENNMPVPESQGTTVNNESDKQSVEKSTGKPLGKVARAIFTTEIIDREPANDIATMDNTSDRIYFFTDLRNLAGQIVTHRWELNNKVMAEVKFKVGEGERWRVYSSKNLLPEWTGVWSVHVSDENDRIINSSEFNYTVAVDPTNTSTTPANSQ